MKTLILRREEHVMKLYFSGVSGSREFEYLTEAKVDHILVDPSDLKHVGPEYKGRLALDSGAYRAFKSGKPMMPAEDYHRLVDSLPLDFAIQQDVIGDPFATLANWERHFSPRAVRLDMVHFVPVYQWRAPRDHLSQYLDESKLVAIGGLVPLMREKDETMYRDLMDLCRAYPGRFHILGMNWVKCIEHMKDLVYSADTSKAWAGGRYRRVIFRHTKNGHLQEAPAKLIPGYEHIGREELNIHNAMNMREYTEEKAA